jgi:hypothetical protein
LVEIANKSNFNTHTHTHTYNYFKILHIYAHLNLSTNRGLGPFYTCDKVIRKKVLRIFLVMVSSLEDHDQE